MDPAYYNKLKDCVADLPPLPDTHQMEQEDLARSKPAPDTNWTVESPFIARGNLDREIDHSDPRMSVGWISTTSTRNPAPSWTVSDPNAIGWYSQASPPHEGLDDQV